MPGSSLSLRAGSSARSPRRATRAEGTAAPAEPGTAQPTRSSPCPVPGEARGRQRGRGRGSSWAGKSSPRGQCVVPLRGRWSPETPRSPSPLGLTCAPTPGLVRPQPSHPSRTSAARVPDGLGGPLRTTAPGPAPRSWVPNLPPGGRGSVHPGSSGSQGSPACQRWPETVGPLWTDSLQATSLQAAGASGSEPKLKSRALG